MEEQAYAVDRRIQQKIKLFTIAGSVLVDHLRRRAHEKKRLSVLAAKMNGDALYIHPSSTSGSFETADYLKAVVQDLPPARKKVILLKMNSGYSNKEIAAQLSISEKTVEDHVTKALRHIRSVLPLPALLFSIPVLFFHSSSIL